MACVENITPGNGDSEMEEGEIVDDLDELSDISSEEEFLLRQRLQVLENYNNVLERKKAKKSFGPGISKEDTFIHDLSEISATDLEENSTNATSRARLVIFRDVKEQKPLKSHYKQKRRKDLEAHSIGRTKDKKKVHRKKKLEVKVISESSEESDDEYRNKRRKLANAVTLNRNKIDKSSLQDRLQNMLCGTKLQNSQKTTEDKQTETESLTKVVDVSCSPIVAKTNEPNELNLAIEPQKDKLIESKTVVSDNICEFIDICTDDDVCIVKVEENVGTVDSIAKEIPECEYKKHEEQDSDEDLELLRQHALKTKASKAKPVKSPAVSAKPEKPLPSEDEDSDTAELRLICLKSALLKKAIEMKRKQKLRKRLSQSSNVQDDFLNNSDELLNKIDSENNTDIESVDMDIGSDADDKGKDFISEQVQATVEQKVNENNENVTKDTHKTASVKEDELEEDEDLLRAKLLISLSKNLPHLVDPNVINTIEKEKVVKENISPAPKIQLPENRIVINLGESDSEGEHEATKNLTKMHMKLSEQIDFQQKLDMFLKSTRMEVEKKKLPDVVQKDVPKTPEKFVAKTVNHLPKSEQIEYKNLVKRMAELEKVKAARQSPLSLINKAPIKDTLKPRNVSMDHSKTFVIQNLDEQITLSRKKIAEESAKILKLKEEGKKLTQKYEIVATELKNISTAITLNKREQRSIQNRLSKIRIQHQRLLNSSINKHSKANGNLSVHRTTVPMAKLQKENNPKEYKNPQLLKSVKVSVVNDILKDEAAVSNPKMSIQVDVGSNKKIVTLPNESIVDIQSDCNTGDGTKNSLENSASLPVVEKGGEDNNGKIMEARLERSKEFDDYESPLQALSNANWVADPNAIMCPFEVGGNCKDADCKYLHPKAPLQ